MYMIIAPITTKLATAIQHYRKMYDPLAEIIPPHITIVKPFPFSGALQTLYTHLDEVGELHSPTKVSLAGWDIYNWDVGSQRNYQFRLPLITGRQEFIFLRNTLLDGPLGHLAGQDQDYWPHVVFGRFSKDSEAEKAKKDLKTFESQFAFRVEQFELMHRNKHIHPWKTLKRFGLKATIMDARRKPLMAVPKN